MDPQEKERYQPLVQALLTWFAVSKRPLPWRERYDPYSVWISEVMLQQTQMERGVAFYERWMARFPTLSHVAAAPVEEILKSWEGLGYYSRARNLHAAARLLMQRHGGEFPQDVAALRALPGVGDYTAGAVASIAFNLPVPAVDANVGRVFARLFDIDSPVRGTLALNFIEHMAAELIALAAAGTGTAPCASPSPAAPVEWRARNFNQALMELGALLCRKKPLCDACPIAAFCRARQLGIVQERPVPGRKVSYSALEIVTGVLVCKDRVFIQKRPESGVWAGFWEFPGGRIEAGESPEQAIVREYGEETEFAVRIREKLGVVRHAYTRYRIVLHCFLCEMDEKKGYRDVYERHIDEKEPVDIPLHLPEPVLHAATEYLWATPSDVASRTFPAGHRKLMEMWPLEKITTEGALPPQTPSQGD